MKKITMVFMVFMAFLVFTVLFTTNYTYANSISDALAGADTFIKEGENQASEAMDTEKINEASSVIYNILLTVGMAAAIIIGVVLGIQFITSGVDEQANIKQALIPYIVGCVVVFGSFGIWKIAVTLMKNI